MPRGNPNIGKLRAEQLANKKKETGVIGEKIRVRKSGLPTKKDKELTKLALLAENSSKKIKGKSTHIEDMVKTADLLLKMIRLANKKQTNVSGGIAEYVDNKFLSTLTKVCKGYQKRGKMKIKYNSESE